MWRHTLMARGIPRTNVLDKPRGQEIANTEEDHARLLNGRGQMILFPEVPEENLLKAMFSQKADWLYCQPDGDVERARRAEIQGMVKEKGRPSTWTKAGRLRCGEGFPPPQNPDMDTLCPPPHLREPQTLSMTRSEVTERRLIEQAMLPPAPPPSFGMSGASVPLARRGASSSGRSSSLDGRPILLRATRPPLTSR